MRTMVDCRRRRKELFINCDFYGPHANIREYLSYLYDLLPVYLFQVLPRRRFKWNGYLILKYIPSYMFYTLEQEIY